MSHAIQLNGQTTPWPLGKIVCVGRNYADHAKELNNPIPDSPLLFIKPASCAAPIEQPLRLPKSQGPCHHELEVALLLGEDIAAEADAPSCLQAIAGAGLALDLTLRSVQDQLKQKGQPWERAKCFAGACPISGFHAIDPAQPLRFSMRRNGSVVQRGDTREMLFSIPRLLKEMAQAFGLQAGDVILTGTPAGVGPLESGDQLEIELEGVFQLSTRVD